MKTFVYALLCFFTVVQACAQNSAVEDEVIKLSKDKWLWMADKNVDKLKDLFHSKAMFVHMGGSWGTEQELNVIGSSGIWYKKADVHDASVKIIDNTAIVLNRITLLAVVGGNEVTNPFVVTEVYVKENGKWKLGVLSSQSYLVLNSTKNYTQISLSNFGLDDYNIL